VAFPRPVEGERRTAIHRNREPELDASHLANQRAIDKKLTAASDVLRGLPVRSPSLCFGRRCKRRRGLVELTPAHHQNSALSASCTFLGPPARLRMAPKPLAPNVEIGVPSWTRLNTFCESARNTTRSVSVTGKRFWRETSVCANAGPKSMFLP